MGPDQFTDRQYNDGKEGNEGEEHPHDGSQRQGSGGKGHDAQIRPQLLGLGHVPEAAHQQEVIQIEVDAEGQHPDTCNNVDICAVVGSHAGVPAGKAAGTGSTDSIRQMI